MAPRSVMRLLLSALAALILPMAFLAPAAHAAGASATATITTSTPHELTIDVRGSGYSEEDPGIYVGVSESGATSTILKNEYRGNQWVQPQGLAGGVFDVTLTLDAAAIATLDPGKAYSVYTRKAHGQAAADPSQTVEVPLNIDFSTLTEADEDGDGDEGSGETDGGTGSDEGDSSAASVTVSQTTFYVGGSATVTIEGKNFDPTAALGTRPPFAGHPAGAYVVFGKFADSWRPSEGAPSANRVIASQKWAVPADQASGGAYVELSDDGSFTAELEIDKSAIDAVVESKDNATDLVNYGIYTYAGSGATVADYETYTPITFLSPEVTVSHTEVSAEGSTTVTVTGENFDPAAARGTRPPFAGRSGGTYVVFGKFAEDWRPSEGAPSTHRAIAEQKWAVPVEQAAGDPYVELSADGSFTAHLSISKKAIDDIVADRANAADLVNYGIYTYAGSGADAASFETYTPIRFSGAGSGDNGGGTTTPDAKTKGSLVWGVKSSFRDYIVGQIAQGRVTVSGGASAQGGTYRFFQKSTSARPDATGTTTYGGTVAFWGHGGDLDLRISDPIVTVSSRSSGTLTAVVNGSRVPFANLNLSNAKKSTSGGAVTFSGAGATLTSAGAAAFTGPDGSSFYRTGEALDPVTFTIGADGGAASGSSTVATTLVRPTFLPPSTPPSSSGLTIEGVQGGDEFKAGDVITASASGFEPNESGIAVVVYSTPVVLSQAVTADAQGNATWTGPLPGSLEPGEHTLTFQGSVDRGVTFTVAEEGDEIGRCSVQDATLTWGVKESWRAYVSGSIANGDWTTSGNASYETPEFTFAGGAGNFDAQTSTGDVTFDGAIEFTGHDGALKVVLADPMVRVVDEDSAVLLLDVTAGDRSAAETGDAETTTTKAVPFAELDLSKATVERSYDGTSITVTDAPATLTEQGHQVFSTYGAGAELDPVDLAVTASADCAQTPEVAAVSSAASVAATGDDGNSMIWWIAGAAALAAVLGGGVWLIRRPGSA